MTLQLDAPPNVLGSQTPRIWSAPESASAETYEAALRIAQIARIDLDEWQKFVLRHALSEDSRGNWAAPTVGLVCPRQNGKNEILAIRELLGLFVLGEQEIVHTAHDQTSASRQFKKLLILIDRAPEFRNKVARPYRGKGSESIELKSGQHILFKTRTGGTERGASVALIVYDEAFELSSSEMSALSPTSLAVDLDQEWFTSSAVDQDKHRNGVELARLRERGLRGTDGLAYFEWSIEGDDPSGVPEEQAADPHVWAQANPALGVRIPVDRMRHKREVAMGPREFAVECLGVGDWPRTDGAVEKIIPPERWAACADVHSRREGRICLAFDVSPERSGAIAAAGFREDGRAHIEVIEHRRGTGWMPERLLELAKKHKPYVVTCDAGGPAGSLLPELENLSRDLVIEPGGSKELVQACGLFYDAILDDQIRHLDTYELNAAVDGAARRNLGEAWAWSRRNSTVDISPLVACTLAFREARAMGGSVAVASMDDYLARFTPEEIAAKQKAQQDKVAAILAKVRQQ